jgi:hypothetical protein
MELKDFGKYIRGKSVHKLLHRARKQSLKRILTSEKELAAARRKVTPPKRVAGAR